MKKESFYSSFMTIAIPVTLQNIILSSINLADVFMIGKLGETSLAALGLSNQIMFLMVLLLFGINSGAGVFISQFWGEKNITSIHKVLGIALISSLGTAGVFWILTQTVPSFLIRVYSPDKEVIRIGSEYLKIVGWSYIATSLTFVYSIQSRNIERVNIGLYSSIMALIINVSFNYILIFGKLGFPAMGVKGAAIATLIARVAETFFVLGYIYYTKSSLRSSFKEMLSFNREFVRKYKKVTTPVILNEMLWALGITTYSMIYGRMSTTSIAVINIVGSVERIIFSGFIGVANAAAVMIGKKIGEKKEEVAINYAYRLGGISFVLGIMGSILLFLIAKPILGIYHLSDEVLKITLYTMYVLCIFLPLKSFNITNVVGILRAGGDTKFGLFMDITTLWAIGVPLAYLVGLKFYLPVYIVFSFAMSEELLKFIIGVRRVISKKWVKNLVEGFE
jgi:putative MATE family efflux protein